MSTEPEHFRRNPRQVTVAAIQMSCDWDSAGNIAKAHKLVREAAARGAQVILLPELFEAPYFCIEQDNRHLNDSERRSGPNGRRPQVPPGGGVRTGRRCGWIAWH